MDRGLWMEIPKIPIIVCKKLKDLRKKNLNRKDVSGIQRIEKYAKMFTYKIDRCSVSKETKTIKSYFLMN